MTSLAFLATLLAPPAADPSPPSLHGGDCVVSIGSALIEREQRYGYWEAALTARLAGKEVRFRNLGWSGDTVFGEAQAGFGTPADGFKHLKEHVLALKPTVLIVGYGGNEAFDGPAGLARFTAGYNTLLDALAPANARLVLLSPLKLEPAGRPLPNPDAQNANVLLYANAVRDIARQRHATFVDLFAIPTEPDTPLPQLTDNGIHLTARGYWRTAPVLERGLGLEAGPWRVALDATARAAQATGTKVDAVSTTAISFRTVDPTLPVAAPAGSGTVSERVLRVRGLTPGSYTLVIDGKANKTATADAWAAGVTLNGGPECEQAERLRAAIIGKNRLYFHRWRPQNETYLFGFRKHEQGQNAREIPQFDPLVAKAEKEIAALAVPQQHTYELKRDPSK